MGRRLAAAAAGLLLLAGPGRAADAPQADREAIVALFASTLEAGYREEDLAKFTAAYLPDAQVGTYIWGLVDPKTYGEKTAKDFAELDNQEVKIRILELAVSGDEARATVDLGMTGDLADGRPVDRHDRYYLLLVRTPAGWRISRQGYRPDFTTSPMPHGR